MHRVKLALRVGLRVRLKVGFRLTVTSRVRLRAQLFQVGLRVKVDITLRGTVVVAVKLSRELKPNRSSGTYFGCIFRFSRFGNTHKRLI